MPFFFVSHAKLVEGRGPMATKKVVMMWNRRRSASRPCIWGFANSEDMLAQVCFSGSSWPKTATPSAQGDSQGAATRGWGGINPENPNLPQGKGI